VSRLCKRAGISRQGWYQNRNRVRQKRRIHTRVTDWVVAERARHPRMGGRKLYYRLKPRMQAAGIPMGRDRFFRLLRRQALLVPPRHSRGPRTTDGRATQWKNRLSQTRINRPNQAWVADITYLRTMRGFCYLALISDYYSRKILGWDVSESLELQGALSALSQALKARPAQTRPIHHSDRGSQYRSRIYIRNLQQHQCRVSMTQQDHCAENARAERLNGILKNEYLLDQVFVSTQQARQAAKQAILLYNTDRPHMALNYATPEQVHRVA